MFRSRHKRLLRGRPFESFPRSPKKLSSALWPKIIIIAGIMGFFIVAGMGAGIIVAFWNNLPSLDMVKSYEMGGYGLQTTIYSLNNELVAKFAEEKRELISLSDVPANLINGIIATEDTQFYHHRGINLKGILRAFISNIKSGRISQGGSTITQQLAKNIFLTQERTYRRKIQEILLAILIERELTKEEILERYLNKIYFGHGIYGVQAASLFYFDKPVKDLSLDECALLAGLPCSPGRYSPLINPLASLERQSLVLKRMEEVGFITLSLSEAAKISMANKIKRFSSKKIFAKANTTINKAPYFTEYIRQELEQEYGGNAIYRGGLKVYTTLDLKMQRAAEIALGNALEGLNRGKAANSPKIEGALVAIEPKTGYIKAMVGGSGFTSLNQMNRAIYAHRQPGSSFKPFIYAAAIENGLPPNTFLQDEPVSYTGANGEIWEPSNYEDKYYGKVTLRTALEHSINIATIKLLEQVGPRRVIALAHRMGIKGRLAADLSLALGVSEVTPLEMTAAYTAFANQGVKTSPIAIRYIKNYTDNLLEEKTIQTQSVISPQVAYLMTNLMEGVVTSGTARDAVGNRLGREVAGKTGTTNDYVDAWFIGFTPELVATVWIGYDKGQISLGHGQAGGVVAAPIWTDFMQRALSPYPTSSFPVPEGVVFKTIDPETGLLATNACPRRRSEVFISNTEPTEYCYLHRGGGDGAGASSAASEEDVSPTNEPEKPELALPPEKPKPDKMEFEE